MKDVKNTDHVNEKDITKDQKRLWFANDADGLSMVDVLTIFYTIFYLLAKIIYICLIVNYSGDAVVISALGTVNESIDSILMLIFSFYFLKKGVDTTVAKIVLGKEYSNLYKPIMNENPTPVAQPGLTGSFQSDKFGVDISYTPKPDSTDDSNIYIDDGTVG